MRARKLIAVETGKHTFEFENKESLKWQGFFDVDTVRLVLGNNGSGKTSLLSDMAASISSMRALPQRSVFGQYEEGVGKLSAAELSKVGVIYFSPLPYRRRIPLRNRFVDASPRFEKNASLDQLEQFYSVAAELGLSSSLRAAITYSSTLCKDILAPALLSLVRSKTGHLNSPVLESFIIEYRKLVMSEEDFRSPYYERGHPNSLFEKRFDALLLKIEGAVLSNLPAGKGRLAMLATLEKMVEKHSSKLRVGRAFLKLNSMADYMQDRRDDLITKDIVKSFDSTLEWLRLGKKNPERKKRSYTFTIESAVQAAQLVSSPAAVEILLGEQSSGVRALVDQFFLLRKAFERMRDKRLNHVLVLIDEGDAYLHLAWQRRYISLLNKFMAAAKKKFDVDVLQLVVATHSPVITGDFPTCMVTNLDKEQGLGATFATPLEDIVFKAFDSVALGEFAAEKINQLHARITDHALLPQDQLLLDSIGDAGIKNALLRVRKDSQKS
ncbi:Predicted ATP-binding protein involved in virulence [Pseudomonas fluorescens]|uniref:Predicted ATP-binding protein involved in virulence n=1 Tax=Pseudomonas fluorescens TaxID=294 RepID=A0A379IC60_PSEFL|nr:AAA family ATPase [Pseudomonas fluorescens]AIG00708.1 hypothetical protein HZ99_00340 [Pseudomonas fluorescens]SUD30374.1 Predicted ATP-binding protein involved in virulence [Pseudomonas fluorescens]